MEGILDAIQRETYSDFRKLSVPDRRRIAKAMRLARYHDNLQRTQAQKDYTEKISRILPLGTNRRDLKY